MNPKHSVVIAALCLLCGLAPMPALAQTPADERARLREDLEKLEAQLVAIKERLRALETPPTPAPAPATDAKAEAEDESHTGPISGYMDFHFNKTEQEHGKLDFHRFVLLFNHSFTDRIRFVGELELEHALVE